MEGYESDTYGDAFADVYDDWYRDLSDVSALVTLIDEYSLGRALCELGVGTGRLKRGLREWLGGLDYIERLVDAEQGDGGAGCTVVWPR